MQNILSELGYDESPNFVRDDELENVKGYAHIFRRAREICGLQGVYLLRPDAKKFLGSTPLVYVCKAKGDKDALRIHRMAWNQNVVPFLLVECPRYLRLYKGFSFTGTPDSGNDPDADILGKLTRGALSEGLRSLTVFRSDIDEGRIWEKWGRSIRPDDRVDVSLLRQLQDLGKWLRKNGLDRQAAHALIGKYVYLSYLRDRKILSDRKLASWDIASDDIFKRRATLKAFYAVNHELDKWLNGSVFPAPAKGTPYRAEHVQKVAGTFSGDTVDGQLHLDFRAYNFSAIPTETLSTIYEQFLHAPTPDGEPSKGKRSAAHYTPLPLVNLTIDELEQQKPLERGMKVLDPSCGSGAFLVQCYRRLIEKERRSENKLTPHRLKRLLTDHIFGVELHEDACQVTALNLILTLLDNVRPPDLEWKRHEKFELPDLLKTNIFRADYFDPDSEWAKRFGKCKFDWVVGNPPWKEVKQDSGQDSEKEEDEHARKWMNAAENKTHPATDNQLAEAFVWEICECLDEQGLAALVLPAMTFTKQNSKFRSAFFAENRVHTVTNLANLRKVLFHAAGKQSNPSGPAVVVCFQSGEPDPADTILTCAPFAVDQVSNRRLSKRAAWSIAINSSDLQELSARDVQDGSHLHWKVAMWGTPRDMRLLRKLQRTSDSFRQFRIEGELLAHQGLEFASTNSVPLAELIGKKKLVFKELHGCGRIFSFPQKAIEEITESGCYIRKGRTKLPCQVSAPPHIILDAARRFAVFSDDWLAVPSRQIGIAGGPEKRELLKALGAYLSSDLVRYWEFLVSSEWGIKSDRATLKSLDTLPIPSALSDMGQAKKWAALYDDLARSGEPDQTRLLVKLNHLVFDALGLGKSERILVEDTVKHRLSLLDGKVPKELLSKPDEDALKAYLSEFRRVLDSFMGRPCAHELTLHLAGETALLQIRLLENSDPIRPRILSSDSDLTGVLGKMREQLRRDHSQCLYFERCLKVYDGDCMYVLKPLQMSQWLRSKALRDADDVIGELLAAEGRAN